jgi:hypothetical protein
MTSIPVYSFRTKDLGTHFASCRLKYKCCTVLHTHGCAAIHVHTLIVILQDGVRGDGVPVVRAVWLTWEIRVPRD